jgi:iron complex outermembrane receptor protein
VPGSKAAPGSISNPYTLVNNPVIIPAGALPGTAPYEAAYGGYAYSGPFAGQQFLNNGQLGAFTLPTATGTSNVGIGGSGAINNNAPLYAPQNINQLYGRFDRDITGTISGFVQIMDSWSGNTANGSNWNNQAETMYSGNPYLPASAQTALTGAGAASFTDIIFPRDLMLMSQQTQLNSTLDVTAGLKGTLFSDYKWELSYTHGESIFRQSLTDNINVPHFLAAIDAVTGPSGTPVCRVSTTSSAALYPGCQPLNLFGEGNESAAAEAYIFQTTQWQAVNTLNDYVASISGSPISDWAGPVSVALNSEFRQQGLVENTNANPLAPVTNVTGVLRNAPATPLSAIYSYATVAPTHASNSVWEVSGETVVPLAKDLPFVKSFDISGAVRYTDYSSSGPATTWKAGLDYQPINDVRIRATESRDIRAPTLYDLYQGQSSIIQALTDPVSGSTRVVNINTLANPNLVPEVSLTTTAGVIYSPSWFPRFRVSVDYYNIDISNAITALAGNNASLLTECQSTPTAPLCTLLIVRGNGANAFPTVVNSESFNAAKTSTDGVDVEASYNLPLSDVYQPLRGNLTTRLLYSYQPTLEVQNFAGAPVANAAGTAGIGGTPGSAGAAGLASSRVTLFLTYNLGPVTASWESRYYSAENRSGTPGQYFVQGALPAYSLSDLSLDYRFKVDGHAFDTFFNVQNLFNTPPRISPNLVFSGIPGFGSPVLPGDDGIGRYFTAGLKFQY